jgi:hypothetical protein
MGLKKQFNKLIKALKDKTNLIIFGTTALVLFSPTLVCGIFGFILNDGWLLGVAATYWAFWLAPLTPFWGLTFAITFAVRKIYDKIRGKK